MATQERRDRLRHENLSLPALETRVLWQEELLDRYRRGLEDVLASATTECAAQTQIAEKALGRTKEDREISESLDRDDARSRDAAEDRTSDALRTPSRPSETFDADPHDREREAMEDREREYESYDEERRDR